MFLGYILGVITGSGFCFGCTFLGYRTAQQHNMQDDDEC